MHQESDSPQSSGDPRYEQVLDLAGLRLPRSVGADSASSIARLREYIFDTSLPPALACFALRAAAQAAGEDSRGLMREAVLGATVQDVVAESFRLLVFRGGSEGRKEARKLLSGRGLPRRGAFDLKLVLTNCEAAIRQEVVDELMWRVASTRDGLTAVIREMWPKEATALLNNQPDEIKALAAIAENSAEAELRQAAIESLLRDRAQAGVDALLFGTRIFSSSGRMAGFREDLSSLNAFLLESEPADSALLHSVGDLFDCTAVEPVCAETVRHELQLRASRRLLQTLEPDPSQLAQAVPGLVAVLGREVLPACIRCIDNHELCASNVAPLAEGLRALASIEATHQLGRLAELGFPVAARELMRIVIDRELNVELNDAARREFWRSADYRQVVQNIQSHVALIGAGMSSEEFASQLVARRERCGISTPATFRALSQLTHAKVLREGDDDNQPLPVLSQLVRSMDRDQLAALAPLRHADHELLGRYAFTAIRLMTGEENLEDVCTMLFDDYVARGKGAQQVAFCAAVMPTGDSNRIIDMFVARKDVRALREFMSMVPDSGRFASACIAVRNVGDQTFYQAIHARLRESAVDDACPDATFAREVLCLLSSDGQRLQTYFDLRHTMTTELWRGASSGLGEFFRRSLRSSTRTE